MTSKFPFPTSSISGYHAIWVWAWNLVKTTSGCLFICFLKLPISWPNMHFLLQKFSRMDKKKLAPRLGSNKETNGCRPRSHNVLYQDHTNRNVPRISAGKIILESWRKPPLPRKKNWNLLLCWFRPGHLCHRISVHNFTPFSSIPCFSWKGTKVPGRNV